MIGSSHDRNIGNHFHLSLVGRYRQCAGQFSHDVHASELPDTSYLLMSTLRRQAGGWADLQKLPRGDNGRALCRWCGIEVQPPRRTFCSDDCVHHWRIRTSPAYVREQVFKRDRGICTLCGEDTMARSRSLRRLPWRARRRRCGELGIPYRRLRSPWDADHVVPVVEGGGQCSLENFRTLCIPCHRKVTAELRLRLRAARVNAPADPNAVPSQPA